MSDINQSNEIKIDPVIYRSRPQNPRILKEERCYDFLENLSVSYERIDHTPTSSIEACVEVEKILGIEICKNLFLCNQQKTKFYLLMLCGSKKFVTKEVSKKIGTSRLSFAPAEFMEKLLDITPGSVSVLGLMNDTEHKITLVIDKDLQNMEYIGVHPCINTSSLKLKSEDIFNKILPELGYEPIFIEI